MNTLFLHRSGKGKAFAVSGAGKSGFSIIELMTTVGMIAILISLAIPSYRDAVEKRQITQGAELIVAFVKTIQSESIKRNHAVAVSYATGLNGSWCLGAVPGEVPCDCMESDPGASAYCALDGVSWLMRDSDVQASNLIQSVSGDGNFVFDPVRGLFTDPADKMSLDLTAAEGQYQISLNVISTGKILACLPEPSQGIHGFQPCPEAL